MNNTMKKKKEKNDDKRWTRPGIPITTIHSTAFSRLVSARCAHATADDGQTERNHRIDDGVPSIRILQTIVSRRRFHAPFTRLLSASIVWCVCLYNSLRNFFGFSWKIKPNTKRGVTGIPGGMASIQSCVFSIKSERATRGSQFQNNWYLVAYTLEWKLWFSAVASRRLSAPFVLLRLQCTLAIVCLCVCVDFPFAVPFDGQTMCRTN